MSNVEHADELTNVERDFLRVALDRYVEQHATVKRPQSIRAKSVIHSERDPAAIDKQARKMARSAIDKCGDDIKGFDIDPTDLRAKLDIYP